MAIAAATMVMHIQTASAEFLCIEKMIVEEAEIASGFLVPGRMPDSTPLQNWIYRPSLNSRRYASDVIVDEDLHRSRMPKARALRAPAAFPHQCIQKKIDGDARFCSSASPMRWHRPCSVKDLNRLTAKCRRSDSEERST
ncbi:MAG TPA: hypothetical protein VL048_13490 [Xanthobacteraceae bacterium]|nr:hypothetical protein [Xanthobacteraceae bacterium]